MSLALDIVNNGELSEVEKSEIDEQIDSIISKHKNNRYEINKLVFESVSALTSSKNYSDELASKGTLKRFWGSITGKNQQLQRKIDSGLAVAQYASQQTLQKLAEQNLMSFELITVVNNKLNASMLEVETEINNIYGTLVTFFKKTKSDIVQLENRVERLERNVNLLNWQNSIEYQMWDGVEYTELDTYSQIVCIVRDFYDITKGEWTTSDLLLLKSAMGIVGINPREVINCGEFVRTLYSRRPLREKLFEGKMSNEHIEDWYVAITSAVNKGVKLQEEESYIVQGVLKCLLENKVNSSSSLIVDSLVDEYAKNELALYPQVNVLAYDLIVELLYNIEQIGYVPSEIVEDSKKEDIEKRLKIAEEKYLKENHQEAFEEFLALAEEKCARAMFFVGEYYKHGYGQIVDTDLERGNEWQKKGASLGEPLSKLNLSYLYAVDSVERRSIQQQVYFSIKEMAEQGDIFAQNEFAYLCEGEEEIYWLERSANGGFWRSINKLRILYYNLAVRNYGKNKSESEYYEAIKYFMKSVELGDADAMCYIGLMYDWGYGFKENRREANTWYKKAAEAGCVIAERFYGNNLYKGYNIDENKNEAKRWLKIAAEGGDEEAKKLLKEYFGMEV